MPRLHLLAFKGMQQNTPPSLLDEVPVAACREALNLRPDQFPLLVPRKVMRFVLEQASAETTFPYRKEAQTFP